MLFKRIEIAIVVQQFVTRFNTKRCDQAIDGFADCIALLTKEAEIASRSDRLGRPARIENPELE